MKKLFVGVSIAIVVGITAGLAFEEPAPVTSRTRQTTGPEQAAPKDKVDLKIGEVRGSCRLDAPPDPIWTKPGGHVTWTVRGKCKGMISIDNFTPPGGPFDKVDPKPASNGNVLHLNVHDTKEMKTQRFTYDVLLDGKALARAANANRADDSVLYVCPSWPCTWPIKPEPK